MAKITQDEVARVARLARLDLSEAKLGEFAPQLDGILAYMDKLSEVDTTDVEPMYGPGVRDSAVREDEAKAVHTRDQVLGNAPESDGEYFIVPRIV